VSKNTRATVGVDGLDDDEIMQLAVELNNALYTKCRELVKRELGPSVHDAKRRHSARLRILNAARVDLERAVLDARADGLTWNEIGAACAMTRQAACDRWGEVARLAQDNRRNQAARQ
jgi:hypothetical protein